MCDLVCGRVVSSEFYQFSLLKSNSNPSIQVQSTRRLKSVGFFFGLKFSSKELDESEASRDDRVVCRKCSEDVIESRGGLVRGICHCAGLIILCE